MKVGFIGLGNMGARMAPKLLSAGHQLTVTDLQRDAAAAICQQGAVWADSPCEVAAASEVVFASLPGPDDVERVVMEPVRGLLEGLQPGSIFVDLSTSAPQMTQKLAAALRGRGSEMLDCPVSSGGGMTFVAGGDQVAFERARPLMEAIATHVYYMGESGSGNIAKLTRQYASFVGFWAQIEALLMAKKAGLDVRTVAEFMDVTGGGRGAPNWINRVFEGDFGTPETAGARLDIVAKDVALAIELARRIDAPAKVGLGADDIMRRGQAHGWGRYEFFKAVQILEQEAGVELRSPLE